MDAPAPFVVMPNVSTSSEDFVARVPAGLQTKQAFLISVGTTLRFPYWKNPGWDGFEDWIGDLSWIDARRVILMHDGAPHLERKDLRIYLEILVGAVEELKHEKRELVVVFPQWTRALADAWSGVKLNR